MISGVKVLIKAIEVLELFARQGPELRVTDVSSSLGLPKPTVYRIMTTLMSKGFLEQCDGNTYRLGIRLFEVGQAAVRHMNVRQVALPVMKRVAAQVDESVTLYVRSGGERVCVEMVESSQPLRHFTEVGKRLPLHAGAAGKVFLAYMDEAEVSGYIAQGLERYTDTTLTGDELIRELVRVREMECAESLAERASGVHSVAAPIRDFTGAVVAALAISGPSVRFPPERMRDLSRVVKDAALEISRALGYVARVRR